jgi:hypothetical protein
MTLFPQLSNFLFSPRHRRGLSRFGYERMKKREAELKAEVARMLAAA